MDGSRWKRSIVEAAGADLSWRAISASPTGPRPQRSAPDIEPGRRSSSCAGHAMGNGKRGPPVRRRHPPHSTKTLGQPKRAMHGLGTAELH
eukprot:scaffold241397_cov31-Tisochrysis_lutea.AAC.3